ncbi:DUF987 family protein [Shigella flexneri]
MLFSRLYRKYRWHGSAEAYTGREVSIFPCAGRVC